MFLSPTLTAALDRITERAGDVRRAFISGAQPARDDVAVAAPGSDLTLAPLCVTPPEGACFPIRDAGGATGYTRDGSFRIADGALVDDAGNHLLGVRAPGGALTELRIDPVDAALGRASRARIEADGTFAYDRTAVDPRTGMRAAQRVVAGRVALARFPAGTKLESADGDRYVPPNGIVPHTGLAGDGSFAALQPMRRERSGIDLDESLARLKDAYVAFDALQAAQTAKGHLGKTAMDLLK